MNVKRNLCSPEKKQTTDYQQDLILFVASEKPVIFFSYFLAQNFLAVQGKDS
jgi:hypothetical protein